MGLEEIDKLYDDKRREDRREKRRQRRREIRRKLAERFAFLLGVFAKGFAGLPGRVFIIVILVAVGAFFLWKMFG